MFRRDPIFQYESECDVNGLKIVRGNTVKLDVFDTGNPDDNGHLSRISK